MGCGLRLPGAGPASAPEGCRVSVLQDEDVLEMGGGDGGYSDMVAPKATELDVEKWLKSVFDVTCVLPNFLKIGKDSHTRAG